MFSAGKEKCKKALATSVCVGAVHDLVKLDLERVKSAVPGTMPGTKLMFGQEPLTNWVPRDESEEVGRAEIIYGKLRKLNAIQKLMAVLYKWSDMMIFGS